MKASHYIKRVKESGEFKQFLEEDPEAYVCSVFFIRDFTGSQNETQVDFYSPKKKNIISFKVNKGVERIPISKKPETMAHKKFIPKPLDENLKMDPDQLKATLVDEMRNRDMTYEIEKILALLNVTDDRAMWNCTGFLKGLGLLQAHIEDESESVLFMEKKSLFDLIKFSGAPGQGMPGMGGEAAANAGVGNIKILPPEIMAPSPEKQKPAEKQAIKQKAVSEPKKKERGK